MKIKKEIELAIVPVIVGLITKDDNWTFVGDMRNKNAEVKSIDILIHVKDSYEWFQRRRGQISSLFSKVETLIENRKYQTKFKGWDVHLIIIEGRESFGLAECVFTLDRKERSILLSRIRGKGFKVDKGKITHDYLEKIFTFPTATSILEFTGLEFKNFIPDFKGYSNV
jgi:hypothetical protein